MDSRDSMEVNRVQGSWATLLLDLTRLLARCRRAVPTGIDRVELEYALGLAGAGGAARCVAFLDAWRLLPRTLVGSLVRGLRDRWIGDDIGKTLTRRVGNDLVRAATATPLRRNRLLAPLCRRPIHLPENTTYLNVSHRNWEYLGALPPPLSGPSARRVIMVHDLMPVRSPQFFPPEFTETFRHGLTQVLRHATTILANSRSTAADLATWAEEQGLATPPIEAIPLGVRPRRSSAATTEPVDAATAEPADSPAFVFVGSLDPRKNIELLLDVWTRWAAAGSAPPRLLLIGAPSEALASRLAELPPGVHVRSGLSDEAVGAELRGATALLLPSWTEGYGLPVVEALAEGVPVIASDLPALREVGSGIPTFLPPDEPEAWLHAVQSFASGASDERERQRRALRDYSPPTWDDHFERLRAVLDA